MSETLIGQLINATVTLIGFVLTYRKASMALTNSKKNSEVLKDVALQTNGISEKLVATTGREEYARGKQEGRDEQAEARRLGGKE